MTYIANPDFPHLLMVYGTLQKAYSNNRVMAGNSGTQAELLGPATTMEKFYMAGGGFPRVAKRIDGDLPSANRTDYHAQVHGEVWQVTDESFKACDQLESHPEFYRREPVSVVLNKDKTRLTAWMYIIVRPFKAYNCLAKNKAGVLEWVPGAW